ncbi:MAG: protein-export chaperone SecB [Gemmatimonas sp.]
MSDPTSPTIANPYIDGALELPPEAPGVQTISQYLKDLSFENPRPFSRARDTDYQPLFDVIVGVHSRPAEGGGWMVELQLRAEARDEQHSVMFLAELVYAGCYVVSNVPEDKIESVLHLTCAPLLFPYARQILDDAIQKGGYPPLHLHVTMREFATLFERHLERKQKEAATGAA